MTDSNTLESAWRSMRMASDWVRDARSRKTLTPDMRRRLTYAAAELRVAADRLDRLAGD